MEISPNRQTEESPNRRPSTEASAYFSVPFEDPSLRWVGRRLAYQQPGRPAPHRPEAGKPPASPEPLPPSAEGFSLPDLHCPNADKESSPEAVERRNVHNKGKSVEKNDSPDEGASDPTAASRNSRGSNTNRFFLRSRVEKPEKSIQFSLTLTHEEIMEDLFIMTGKKPSARPKRHPKNVQRQLAALFPGSDLPERVAPDMYDVNK